MRRKRIAQHTCSLQAPGPRLTTRRGQDMRTGGARRACVLTTHSRHRPLPAQIMRLPCPNPFLFHVQQLPLAAARTRYPHALRQHPQRARTSLPPLAGLPHSAHVSSAPRGEVAAGDVIAADAGGDGAAVRADPLRRRFSPLPLLPDCRCRFEPLAALAPPSSSPCELEGLMRWMPLAISGPGTSSIVPALPTPSCKNAALPPALSDWTRLPSDCAAPPACGGSRAAAATAFPHAPFPQRGSGTEESVAVWLTKLETWTRRWWCTRMPRAALRSCGKKPRGGCTPPAHLCRRCARPPHHCAAPRHGMCTAGASDCVARQVTEVLNGVEEALRADPAMKDVDLQVRCRPCHAVSRAVTLDDPAPSR